MILNPLELKETVMKILFKYLAVCTFTVRVMASGTPLDLKEDVFVRKICRIMTGYAKLV